MLTPIGDETFVNYEGCLSVPDLRGEVVRHARVRVQAVDRDGNTIDEEVAGITAGTYQHECDHLIGKVYVDRMTSMDTLSFLDEFARYAEESAVA